MKTYTDQEKREILAETLKSQEGVDLMNTLLSRAMKNAPKDRQEKFSDALTNAVDECLTKSTKIKQTDEVKSVQNGLLGVRSHFNPNKPIDKG